MLTEPERQHIRLEEEYRFEIRQSLEARTLKAESRSLWAYLNSNLGLWLLSAVFISGAGTLYTKYQADRDVAKARMVAVERIDLEVAYRFSQALGRLDSVRVRNEKDPLLWGGRVAEDIKEIIKTWKGPATTDMPALYPEHGPLSLHALMAELRRQLTPGPERDAVDRTLAEIVGGGKVGRRFDEFQNVSQAGKVIFSLLLPRWRGNWFFHVDCNEEMPFC